MPGAFSSGFSNGFDIGDDVADPDVLAAIRLTESREASGAVQYLPAAFVSETPDELDAGIRVVADRAAAGAVTYTPAALSTYLDENG